MVDSSDTSGTLYAITVRVQDATTKKRDNTKNDTPVSFRGNNVRIGEVQGMMTEVSKQRVGNAPDNILFFRDSVEFDNIDVREEIQATKYGFGKARPEERTPKVTYMIVNKNTALPTRETNDPDGKKYCPNRILPRSR